VIGLSMSTILHKNRPIIEVGQSLDLGNCGLAVARNYFTFADLVVLHVDHFEFWHFYKNFIDYFREVDFVALNIYAC
jgi:hypothetical protein